KQASIPFADLLPSAHDIKLTNKLTLYSTDPGGVAMDGDRVNSPFTAAFLEHLRNNTLDVFSVFTRVTRDVRKKTGEKQIPWIEGSLETPIYLSKLNDTQVTGITSIAVLDSCRNNPFSLSR